jgi:hypothetical protein
MNQPLNNFSQCHARFLTALSEFGELPALLSPIQRARQIASDMIRLFGVDAQQHHREEERELFPAVLAASQDGEERERVQVLINALTREHHDIESQWQTLAPHLHKLAQGEVSDVDPEAIRQLVSQYKAHARFEEMEFLPLSEKILTRSSAHMAALGLSLHMRHQRAEALQ